MLASTRSLLARNRIIKMSIGYKKSKRTRGTTMSKSLPVYNDHQCTEKDTQNTRFVNTVAEIDSKHGASGLVYTLDAENAQTSSCMLRGGILPSRVVAVTNDPDAAESIVSKHPDISVKTSDMHAHLLTVKTSRIRGLNFDAMCYKPNHFVNILQCMNKQAADVTVLGYTHSTRFKSTAIRASLTGTPFNCDTPCTRMLAKCVGKSYSRTRKWTIQKYKSLVMDLLKTYMPAYSVESSSYCSYARKKQCGERGMVMGRFLFVLKKK
jgi:hypothetical protein